MRKQIEQVKQFHDVYRQKYQTSPTAQTDEICNLRYKLGLEELNEYKEANDGDDPVGIADALADQLYILLGTILAHGMADIIEDVFDEVHRSNMSKLDENGNPIYREDGKILKGPNYKKPDIGKIIHSYWEAERAQPEIPFKDAEI
jgi:predicted HAD superfamily Cof-like phosphohydrolase